MLQPEKPEDRIDPLIFLRSDDQSTVATEAPDTLLDQSHSFAQLIITIIARSLGFSLSFYYVVILIGAIYTTIQYSQHPLSWLFLTCWSIPAAILICRMLRKDKRDVLSKQVNTANDKHTAIHTLAKLLSMQQQHRQQAAAQYIERWISHLSATGLHSEFVAPRQATCWVGMRPPGFWSPHRKHGEATLLPHLLVIEGGPITASIRMEDIVSAEERHSFWNHFRSSWSSYLEIVYLSEGTSNTLYLVPLKNGNAQTPSWRDSIEEARLRWQSPYYLK